MARLQRIEVDANLRTHHKAAALAVALQDPRAWTWLVELWMWASQNQPEGLIPGPAARLVLEHVLGWRGTPGLLVESLINSGWLDVTEAGLQIHDWAEHAGAHIAKSERDAAKMKEYRNRVRERYGNVTVTDGNKSERDGNVPSNHNQNPNHNRKEEEKESAAPPGPPPEALKTLWNDKAHPSLPRCEKLTKKRKGHAVARMAERTLESFDAVVQRINASSFCLGENDRGWRASFDWLIQPDTATKVLEGKYDRGPGPPTHAARGRASNADKDWTAPVATTASGEVTF